MKRGSRCGTIVAGKVCCAGACKGSINPCGSDFPYDVAAAPGYIYVSGTVYGYTIGGSYATARNAGGTIAAHCIYLLCIGCRYYNKACQHTAIQGPGSFKYIYMHLYGLWVSRKYSLSTDDVSKRKAWLHIVDRNIVPRIGNGGCIQGCVRGRRRICVAP